MKKRTGIPLAAGVVVVAALFLNKGLGLGLGSGLGLGTGTGVEVNAPATSVTDSTKTVEATETSVESSTEDKGKAMNVTIEVKQGQYYMDGKEITLSQIEEILRGSDPSASLFTIEDNYGSAKAWDEIRELFAKYQISMIEK